MEKVIPQEDLPPLHAGGNPAQAGRNAENTGGQHTAHVPTKKGRYLPKAKAQRQGLDRMRLCFQEKGRVGSAGINATSVPRLWRKAHIDD